MKRRISIAIVVILVGFIAVSAVLSQTVQTPNAVRITNDGYNNVTTVVTGTRRGLDVNIIQMPAISTSSGTTPVTQGTSPWVTSVTGTPNVQVWAETDHDTGNSTTSTLLANQTFTGTAFHLDNYASYSVDIYADVASATNGLKVQWSTNGTDWDFADQSTYNAAVGNMITFGAKSHYVRVAYTNGATPQGAFRMAARAQKISVRQTRKFLGAQLTDQDTGQVVMAALQGHTTAGGGSWVDVKVNPSGALAVDATQATSPWVTSGTVTANQGGTWTVTQAAKDRVISSGTVTLGTSYNTIGAVISGSAFTITSMPPVSVGATTVDYGIYNNQINGNQLVRSASTFTITGMPTTYVTATVTSLPSSYVTATITSIPAMVVSGGTITFGTYPLTANTPTVKTIGASSSVAYAPNASRKGLIAVNTSTTNWMSLAFGTATAILYGGITLAPNGGAFNMDAYSFSTGTINAISSGASTSLAIQEYQ